MAVFRNHEFDFNDENLYTVNEWDSNLSRDDIMELFGDDYSTSIYTGQITSLSDDRKVFGHDINSYKGCSGAIIFLLDKNQAELIKNDVGKAIGIHVGGVSSSTDGKINIAFTVPARHLLNRNAESPSQEQIQARASAIAGGRVAHVPTWEQIQGMGRKELRVRLQYLNQVQHGSVAELKDRLKKHYGL
eukprot:Sro2021_g311420.1 n/a (189) ;mRNA; r:5019-5585